MPFTFALSGLPAFLSVGSVLILTPMEAAMWLPTQHRIENGGGHMERPSGLCGSRILMLEECWVSQIQLQPAQQAPSQPEFSSLKCLTVTPVSEKRSSA